MEGALTGSTAASASRKSSGPAFFSFAASDRICRKRRPPGAAVVEPEHVPRDGAKRHARRELRLRVRHQRVQDVGARARPRFVAEQARTCLRQEIGIVIGDAAQHHAIDVRKLALDGVPVFDPAVQHDGQRREIALQLAHDFVAQWRHLAILLGRQPLQDRIARMDDEHIAAGGSDGADEVADEGVGVIVIESDSVLDGHRHRYGVAHRLDAIGDDSRLRHQARAEAAGLHALGRAAAVEIDLVVTPALAELRARGELAWIAAAELQRERMLGRVEIEVVRNVAVLERAARDHLGVETRARRDQAQEVSAVPIGPVHHRRDADAVRANC